VNKRKLSAIAFVVVVFLPGMITTAAQTQALKFEVATIKPNNSGNSGSNTAFPPGGRFSAKNVWLKLLIRIAYGLPAYQVTGGPDWTGSVSRFDVEAKAEGNVSQDETLRMLQTLLAERFKLQFHHIKKEDAAYALVTGKGGPKFKAVADNGTGQHFVGAGHGKITATNGEMSRFVWFVTQVLDRQVVDKTGLNGFYDFVFVQPATIFPSPDSSQPTLFDELQDQLGLRLEPIKAPVDFIVIDHAEKPDAN
jgi:uncharacterized protein (TIGR03435 family)